MTDHSVRSGGDELVIFEDRELVCEEAPEGVIAKLSEVTADNEEKEADDERGINGKSVDCGRVLVESRYDASGDGRGIFSRDDPRALEKVA